MQWIIMAGLFVTEEIEFKKSVFRFLTPWEQLDTLTQERLVMSA